MAPPQDWKTKPTDRFVLKWIKIHLSARITPRLAYIPWLRPWMITLVSTSLGVTAGALFALGWGWVAGCLAATSQVFDGVDGQVARLTGRQSKSGAYWDSVLDRYTDGAMVMGMLVYLLRIPLPLPPWLILALGFLAIVGSNGISYSTARAESLGITLGRPTLASKGTRSTVMVLGAWGSLLWAPLPFIALLYLALHTNIAILRRLLLALRGL